MSVHPKNKLFASAGTLVVLTSAILLVGLSLDRAQAQETTGSLEISGQTYDIPYEITGGSVEEMTAQPDFNTLLVMINSTEDGTLTIDLPTDVIDAEDDEFSVFVDGESGNFVFDELEPTDEARVLQIEFPSGAGEIEIVGTTMIPEFGTVGAIILAVSVFGMIVATYRKFPNMRTM